MGGKRCLQHVCLLSYPELSINCPDAVGVIDGGDTTSAHNIWGDNERLAVIYCDADRGAWSRRTPPGLLLSPCLGSIVETELNLRVVPKFWFI